MNTYSKYELKQLEETAKLPLVLELVGQLAAMPFVQRIQVVQTKYGTDTVLLTMDFPSALTYLNNQPLHLKFEATAGTGEKYCKKHFPNVPIEIINT